MSRSHRVQTVILAVSALLVLLAALPLVAQKETTQQSNDFGLGTTLTTYYNADGTVSQVVYTDAKGKTRQ
jgi:hypothetical protein